MYFKFPLQGDPFVKCGFLRQDTVAVDTIGLITRQISHCASRYGFMPTTTQAFRWYVVCVYFSDSNMLHFMLQTMSDNTSQLSGKIHPPVLVLDLSRSLIRCKAGASKQWWTVLSCVEEVLLCAWTPVSSTSPPDGKYDSYATTQGKTVYKIHKKMMDFKGFIFSVY